MSLSYLKQFSLFCYFFYKIVRVTFFATSSLVHKISIWKWYFNIYMYLRDTSIIQIWDSCYQVSSLGPRPNPEPNYVGDIGHHPMCTLLIKKILEFRMWSLLNKYLLYLTQCPNLVSSEKKKMERRYQKRYQNQRCQLFLRYQNDTY